MKLERWLFIPDCHWPNADVKAWELMLKVARSFKPDGLCILGDFIDFDSMSSHDRDNLSAETMKSEVASADKALAQLDALGPTKKIFVEGNHCQRLRRYLAKNAPALDGMVSVQAALNLYERGWEWVPYRESIKIGKLHVTHDTGKAGKNAHRQSAAAFMGSTIIGHTHRMAYEVNGTFDGLPYLACMLGWLGSAKKAGHYTHEANAAEWAHGFGLGYMEPGGVVHVTPVPIVAGKCLVEGRLFT